MTKSKLLGTKDIVLDENIKFDDYLKSILTKKQYRNLKEAMNCGDVIIIKGEQGASGKSTLVDVLRRKGHRVFEEYEVHYVELNDYIKNPTPNPMKK